MVTFPADRIVERYKNYEIMKFLMYFKPYFVNNFFKWKTNTEDLFKSNNTG